MYLLRAADRLGHNQFPAALTPTTTSLARARMTSLREKCAACAGVARDRTATSFPAVRPPRGPVRASACSGSTARSVILGRVGIGTVFSKQAVTVRSLRPIHCQPSRPTGTTSPSARPAPRRTARGTGRTAICTARPRKSTRSAARSRRRHTQSQGVPATGKVAGNRHTDLNLWALGEKRGVRRYHSATGNKT